jgi:hypothetical protein
MIFRLGMVALVAGFAWSLAYALMSWMWLADAAGMSFAAAVVLGAVDNLRGRIRAWLRRRA